MDLNWPNWLANIRVQSARAACRVKQQAPRRLRQQNPMCQDIDSDTKKGSAPVAGADLRAALVASCFRGALPPVDLRAVCFVRAIVMTARHKLTKSSSGSDNTTCRHQLLMQAGHLQEMFHVQAKLPITIGVQNSAQAKHNRSRLSTLPRPGTQAATVAAAKHT